MNEVIAGLIVLEAKRLHGDKITLEQLHTAIVEALELQQMELPYESAKVSRGLSGDAEAPHNG